MEKMAMMRSVYRSICLRSLCSSASASTAASRQPLHHGLRRFHLTPSHLPSSPKRFPSDCRPPFSMAIGGVRSFSDDVSHIPEIKDPDVLRAFKDLLAASWEKLPNAVIQGAKKALSKNTDDKAGQEALANVLRAAEAVEEFSGVLIQLRMAIDDYLGISGEDVKPLTEEYSKALSTAYQKYINYLNAFGPDETYLRKKVENEIGVRLIHLKMRCGGMGSEWGKVTVLGTSGLSGSYVEQRA